MTETLQRPTARPSAHPARRPRPPVVAGALAALRAGLGSLLLVVLVVLAGWAADDRSGGAVADALRGGARVWLVAHGTPLEVPPGRFSLLPLGLSVLPLVLLWRAGRSVARSLGTTSVTGAARAAALVVAPYAALTGVVALGSDTYAVEPSPLHAVLGGGLLALVGAGGGALAHERLWRAAWLHRRDRTRRTLAAAATSLAALAAGGALLAGGSLAVHGTRTAELFDRAAPGPLGAAGLLLLSLAYVPTAVVWAVCWSAGPGFAVGTGTAVGPFAHDLGPVPALPLLAALPEGGLPTWVGALALAVPLTAGVHAGRVLHRAAEGSSRTAVTVDVLLTALYAGAAVAVLAALSAGAVGGRRLASVGPSAWECGLAVGVEVGAAALLTTWELRRRARR